MDAHIAVGASVLAPCCHVYDPVGEHAFLSNYAATPITEGDVTWPTAEHLYQASKFEDGAVRDLIRAAPTPAAAKAIAWDDRHARFFCNEWDNRRLEVMRRVLLLKFDQSPAAAAALVRTWPQPIVETSPDDAFWGVGAAGQGENRLGRLLVEQRGRLLEHPSLFELSVLPAGRGGPSCSQACPALWIGPPVVDRFSPRLAYDAFHLIDIREALDLAGQGDEDRLETHARLLDHKYAGYEWTEDARSVVPHWTRTFHGLLAERLSFDLNDARIIAVGAGSANESENVWRTFGAQATLVDWGVQLIENCRQGAPNATALRCRAEDLVDVGCGSQDLYVSLRTYDSALIDVPAALKEAGRVLRPGGLVVVSVSDGYLTAEGAVVRGQIGPEGEIDRAASWRKLVQVAQTAVDQGLSGLAFFDLQTEIGFTART